MRSVLVASLRTHTRRYVAALVAVTIAVGFVVVTNALASATKAGLAAGVGDTYRGDLVVGDPFGVPEADVDRTLGLAARSGDAADVIGTSWQPVRAGDRSLGDDVALGTVSTDPALMHQTITSGRAPRSDGEALMTTSAAKAAGVGLGDALQIGADDEAVTVHVVGLAAGTSYYESDLYVPWATLDRLPDATPDAVVYDVRGSESLDTRAAQLEELAEAAVSMRADYVDQRLQMVNSGVDVISYLLLLFAAIAGFVAVLVIANTFTILFAQRTRDLALLRCVGATRRQILRSVRVESLTLAVVAAATGIVAGAGAGYGITAIVRAFAGADRIGSVNLSPTWLVAAFGGGLLATLAAAWWPTRSVVRVSPLAALRPPQPVGVGDPAGRFRIALGIVTAAAGAGLLAIASSTHSMPVLMLGGMVSFVGVLLLGPVIVPAMLRLAGLLLGPIGLAPRIAAANAVRNPRRSAATTASLLVGVTLTTAVLTGMASARDAIGSDMDAEHPIDAALTGTTRIPDTLVERVAATRDVIRTVTVDGVPAHLPDSDEPLTVLAPDRAARSLAHDPRVLEARDGEVLVPPDAVAAFPDGVPPRIDLIVDGRTTKLDARLVSSDWGRAMIVSPATLGRLDGDLAPLAVWSGVASGTDADELGGDLRLIVAGTDLDLTNAVKDRGWVEQQLGILVWAVLGMLGVGVAIALVGIANTIGLSVLERGREHALLRALGLTRRQLRRLLATEGLLLAATAAVLGTALGATYGWLGTVTIVRTAVADAPVVIPWAQLGAVALVAALAGLLACVVPARRAAQVAPAAGLTVD